MKLEPIHRIDVNLLTKVRGMKKFPQRSLVPMLVSETGLTKQMIWKILNAPAVYNNSGTKNDTVDEVNGVLRTIASEFK